MVISFRRTSAGFVREVYVGLEAVVRFEALAIDLPLAEIFEGVALKAEVEGR